VVAVSELGAARIAALRETEFARLDRTGEAYLDYTGTALYPESLVAAHAAFLQEAVLGNPHSEHRASAAASDIIAEARRAVLEFFQADPAEYAVVFAANASSALRIVGEAFPFGPDSTLALTADNHNSVNGVREFAGTRGARIRYLPPDAELRLAVPLPVPIGRGPHLAAFPAQSNFSGVRYPPALIREAQRLGYLVMLDAAASVPSSVFSLAETQPDFVCLSFYKMIGFPTGVGALLARRRALARLRRPWFAGGTVEFASVQHRRHRLASAAEGFEDGTPNFLDIAAVPRGLAFLTAVGMPVIECHVARMTDRLLAGLRGVDDTAGYSAVTIYGPSSTDGRGGTVAFNVTDRHGAVVPFGVVERAASAEGVLLRGGCFCNPGASEAAFRLDPVATDRCLRGFAPGAFTPERFSACLGGAPVGALRASVGLATNERDIDRLVAFLGEFLNHRSAAIPERRGV